MKTILAVVLTFILCACGGGGGGSSEPVSQVADMSGRWHIALYQPNSTTGQFDVAVNLIQANGLLTGASGPLYNTDCNPCAGNQYTSSITSVTGKVSGNNFAMVITFFVDLGRWGGTYSLQMNLTGTVTGATATGNFSNFPHDANDNLSSNGSFKMNR